MFIAEQAGRRSRRVEAFWYHNWDFNAIIKSEYNLERQKDSTDEQEVIP